MNMVLGSFAVAASQLIGIKSDFTGVGFLRKKNKVVAHDKHLMSV